MTSRLTNIIIIDRLVEKYGELPTGLLVVSITLVAVLIVNHLVRTYLGKHLKNAGLRAVSLLTNMVRVVVVVVAIFFLGENVFHVQMSGMIQALGVTTLVVSLGLQDVIKSLVAGVLVVGGNIVSVGDQVILGEHRGEVMDINWHQVTIRDRDGVRHIIPNATLMDTTFLRLKGKMAYRHMFECAVSPGANLQLVKVDMEAVAGNVLTKHGWNAPGYSPQVLFLGATAFGTTASVRIFIDDIEHATAAMDAVMCAIAERGYLSDTIRQVDPRWK
ncbi:MAG: mechanosensitive ion channel [Coriobacteriales bacterium]|nr:mechanosensitive ion channel [Coriobacteriales bacterium]